MPLDFCFDRTIAERQFQAFIKRQSVAPDSSDGWTYQELLQLAACASLAAIMTGPPDPAMQPEATEKMKRKERVHRFRHHKILIEAVLKLFVDMTDRLADSEEYELFYDPLVVGTATLREDEDHALKLVLLDRHGSGYYEVTPFSEPAQVDIEITRGAMDAESRKVEVMVLA